MKDKTERKIMKKLKPHSVYSHEDVKRKRVFWSQVFAAYIGALVALEFPANLAVAPFLAMVAIHFIDFAFWYFDEHVLEKSVSHRILDRVNGVGS